MYTLPNFNEDFAGRFDFDDDLPELTAAELAGIEAGYQAMVAEETARAKADSNGGRLVAVRVAEAHPRNCTCDECISCIGMRMNSESLAASFAADFDPQTDAFLGVDKNL